MENNLDSSQTGTKIDIQIHILLHLFPILVSKFSLEGYNKYLTLQGKILQREGRLSLNLPECWYLPGTFFTQLSEYRKCSDENKSINS